MHHSFFSLTKYTFILPFFHDSTDSDSATSRSGTSPAPAQRAPTRQEGMVAAQDAKRKAEEYQVRSRELADEARQLLKVATDQPDGTEPPAGQPSASGPEQAPGRRQPSAGRWGNARYSQPGRARRLASHAEQPRQREPQPSGLSQFRTPAGDASFALNPMYADDVYVVPEPQRPRHSTPRYSQAALRVVAPPRRSWEQGRSVAQSPPSTHGGYAAAQVPHYPSYSPLGDPMILMHLIAELCGQQLSIRMTDPIMVRADIRPALLWTSASRHPPGLQGSSTVIMQGPPGSVVEWSAPRIHRCLAPLLLRRQRVGQGRAMAMAPSTRRARLPTITCRGVSCTEQRTCCPGAAPRILQRQKVRGTKSNGGTLRHTLSPQGLCCPTKAVSAPAGRRPRSSTLL